MNKSKLIEARDNADAAAINLSTVLTHRGKKDMTGTFNNARSQLQEALRLLDEAISGAPFMFAADLPSDKPTASTPRATWTKVPGGIEIANHGSYQIAVTGMRGDWYYTVTKTGSKDPDRKGNTTTKRLAQDEGIGWADELMDDDQRKLDEKRAAPIGFAKLEAALEKARSSSASDRRSCSYEGSAPATLDDVHNIVDNFVASLIHSLDTEPG